MRNGKKSCTHPKKMPTRYAKHLVFVLAILAVSIFSFANKGWAPCGTFLGDYVWNDANGNGIQDANEHGIEDVKVILKAGNGAVLESTYTDANGYYEFKNHCPDDYIVEVDESTLPDGYVASPCSDDPDSSVAGNDKDSNCSPQALTLGNNEQNETIDFGYHEAPSCTGTIGNLVWQDVDHDGVQSSGDTGISGVTVRLLDAQGSVVATDTTDSNGRYEFTGLCAGEYEVVVDETSSSLNGLDPVTPCSSDSDPGGSGNDVDSNCSPQSVTLSTDDSENQTIDFGYVAPCTGTIGDLVWRDVDGDGVQSSIDAGIGGVTIQLLNDQGLVISTATTDSNGHYQFSGLCAGDYEVVVDETSSSLNGLDPVTPCSSDSDPGGSGNDVDSNCSPQAVSLDSDSAQNMTIDFGYVAECGPCEGKVTKLTLKFNGNARAYVEVVQKKDRRTVFADYVSPGEEFTFSGTDKKGTLGTEIRIYVDGSLNTKIHTSCSQPIGIGMVFGDFVITDGYSRNGGRLCPAGGGPGAECGPCDGKVTKLTLKFNGDARAYVEVVQKKGGTVFADYVSPGEEFTFSGTDKKGTLGTEIRIYVDGSLNTKIHTSCSQPIGIGMVFGDFVITDGYSRNGGRLCPADGCDCCSCSCNCGGDDSDSGSDSGYCGDDSGDDSDSGHSGCCCSCNCGGDDSDSGSDSGYCGDDSGDDSDSGHHGHGHKGKQGHGKGKHHKHK